jgi:hypothetical protein
VHLKGLELEDESINGRAGISYITGNTFCISSWSVSSLGRGSCGRVKRKRGGARFGPSLGSGERM